MDVDMNSEEYILKYDVEYNNLVLHFGADEFLTHFEKRFMPIFKRTLKRSYGETYLYKFLDVKLIKIQEDIYLTGRLMARMNLKARQKYKNGKLRHSSAQMTSDPTSIFAIRLVDHKVFVIPEQPRSPKSKTFAFVLSKILSNEWQSYYNHEREKFLEKKGKTRLTREEQDQFFTQFLKKYPEPILMFNPIGSPENVESLLESFHKVKSLKLTFNKTNNENYFLDELLLDLFSEAVEKTNSNTGVQEFKNNKEGLVKNSVQDLVKASTETGGNCSFVVKGVANDGQPLNRTDEHTQVKPKIEVEDATVSGVAKKAADKLAELVLNGHINLAEITDIEVKNQIVQRIYNSARGVSNG